VCVCVCVCGGGGFGCVCACMCARLFVRVSARACVRAHSDTDRPSQGCGPVGCQGRCCTSAHRVSGSLMPGMVLQSITTTSRSGYIYGQASAKTSRRRRPLERRGGEAACSSTGPVAKRAPAHKRARVAPRPPRLSARLVTERVRRKPYLPGLGNSAGENVQARGAAAPVRGHQRGISGEVGGEQIWVGHCFCVDD
jgi:hypothetical protein